MKKTTKFYYALKNAIYRTLGITPVVKFYATTSDAVKPVYATDGSACFDFFAVSNSGHIHPIDDNAWVFPTGLKVEIPYGWCLEIHSRSGHGFNYATRLTNCTGIIDSDYRGEIMISLTTDAKQVLPADRLIINAGERIAQGRLVPVYRTPFQEVGLESDLSSTQRGQGGFGSTGK